MTALAEALRQMVGQEVTYEAPEPFGAAAFRYFALAIGDDNPRWQTGEAPPTFVCESNQYLQTQAQLVNGGHRWPSTPEQCRVLRGGHQYAFFRPVRADDRVRVTWCLADVRETRASSGTPLLIVQSEATYRTVAGELLALNRETLIFQEIS